MSSSKPCQGCPSAATCPSAQNPDAPCPSAQQQQPQGQESGCSPDKCANCPSKGNCASNMLSPEIQEIAAKLKKVGRVLIVLSGKGGVGKSTVATQLAFYLADRRDFHVGLVDVDICGPSIPTMTHTQGSEIHPSADGWGAVEVTPNLSVVSIGFMLRNIDDPVILRGPKKHGIISQFLKEVDWKFEEPYDRNMLVIDTPPGTSDEHLSVINTLNAALKLAAADGSGPVVNAVLVSTPQEVALSDVRKELNFCKQIGITVAGVIENMAGFVCPCCNRETQIFRPATGGVRKMCEDYNVTYLGHLPLDPTLTQAGEQGIPWTSAVQDPSTCLGFKLFADIADSLVAK